jgi:nitronate monooxygenase
VRKDAARIRALTDRPFGIDLFIDPKPAPIEAAVLRAAHERLRTYYDELGLVQLSVRPFLVLRSAFRSQRF